jgi:hypothetical protein
MKIKNPKIKKALRIFATIYTIALLTLWLYGFIYYVCILHYGNAIIKLMEAIKLW